MINADTTARLIFDLLDAHEGDIADVGYALRDLAAAACPQGAAVKVAYLNELVAAIAIGGERAADREIAEAQVRKVEPPAPGFYDEREDAVEDIKVMRDLRRLLTANVKRAAKASRDILDQVPN